jgi:hypothetical protein
MGIMVYMMGIMDREANDYCFVYTLGQRRVFST